MISPSSDFGDRLYKWESRHMINSDDEDETMMQAYNLLEAYFDGTSEADNVDLHWCESASYVATNRGSNRKRSYPHLTVCRGSVVSIVVQDHNSNRSVVIQESDCSIGVMEYYAVYGVISASNGDVWCAVWRVKSFGEGGSTIQSQPAVLKMGERVCRVGTVHVCSSECMFDISAKDVIHSETVLDGGMYKIITRYDGYPPHLG